MLIVARHHARDNKSGTFDTFKSLVLAPFKKSISGQATRYESSDELSAAVTNPKDQGAVHVDCCTLMFPVCSGLEVHMKGREFQQLIAETGKLTATQRQTLATVLSGQGGWVEVATLIEARFSEDARCPHCQDVRVKPWGRSCGLARYRCGGCGKSFNALTGTPLARLRKRSAWLAYAAALADGVSVRKAAARSGVSTPTSFRWRHRFLKGAMDTKAEVVAGVVEADETFFLKSFKGARQIDRAPRKRGGKASKPGLSDEQVPVLVVRDRSGATTDAVLENLQAASIHGVLKPVVAADAMLVSDGADAYASFAAETGIGHVGLVTSRGEYRRGAYHIQNVNAYHSRLKTWMRRFNGVATKYLASYLGWRRLFEREGDALTAQRCFLAAFG